MKRHDELEDLKTLDPATDTIDLDGPRARATLERVLASDVAVAVRPRRTRRRTVRIAVAAVAAAVVTATVLLPRDSGPTLSGDLAYANWTAQPGGISAKERAKAVKQCRKMLKGMGFDDQLDRAGTAMVDRRGDWAVVILTGHDQFAGQCMTSVNPRVPGGYGFIDGPGRPPLSSRQLALSTLGGPSGGAALTSGAFGRAGSDIVGMAYHSPTHGEVQATVQNGYFAFWVPGREFDGDRPVPVQVTYKDGTSAQVHLRMGS